MGFKVYSPDEWDKINSNNLRNTSDTFRVYTPDEWEQKNRKYIPPLVTPNDTIDTMSGAAPIVKPPTSTIQPQQNETWVNKAGNFLEKVNNTIGMPIKSISDSLSLGINSAIRSKLFPEQQKAVEEYQAQRPIATTIGNIAGSIAPSIAIEKLAVKTLPSVFEGLNPLTKLAARGIAGAGGYGAAEGLTEGIKNNMGVGGTLQNMGSKAYDYSLGAGIATPILTGIGKGITAGINKYTTSQGLKNIDNTMERYAKEGITSRPNMPQRNITPNAQPILSRQNIQRDIQTPSNTNNMPESPLNANEVNPPKYSFENIKRIEDLPNDAPSLEAYVKHVQDKQNNGYKLLDIDLQLFAEAQKRLANLSKFYTNTIQRAKEIPDHIKEQIDPNDFEVAKQKVSNWDTEAKFNVATNRAKIEENIRNAESISGGVQGHEAAEIMRKLIDEGDPTKVIDWLKIVSKKGTETARGLKSIDSAFPKNSKEYQLLKTQRAVDKTTDDILKQNPKIKNEVESTTKKAKKIKDDIKKETDKVIDDVVNEQATHFPKMLKDRITNSLNPKTPEEKGFIKTMLDDLFGEAKENIPFPKAPKLPDNSINRLANSYKYREYYGLVRTKAQELLKQEFKDSPDALAILDDYFNKGFKPPHSQKLLNDILNKRLSGLNATNKTVTISNKPNLATWVKDWYSSGRAARENFVDSIIRETGLSGDEAQSLKNLLDSKLHVATKQMKDRLLETVMAPKKEGVLKSATNKINELVNIGLLENKQFTNRINEKLSPLVKQLLKENGINLNEIVKTTLLGQSRLKVLNDVIRNSRIDDAEILKVTELIRKEFNALADKQKDKILKGVFEPKNSGEERFAIDRFNELTNSGMFESTKYANILSEKLDPTMRKLLNENGITMNELVRLSSLEKSEAKQKFLSTIFDETKVSSADRDKLMNFIDNEFNKIDKNTRTKILTEMAKPNTTPTKRTMVEKLREKINLGLYGDDVDSAIQDAIKQKYNLPTLSDDEVKFITETMDSVKGLPESSEPYLEAMAKLEKLILEKTPASLSQKVGSGAFVNMLLNTTSGVVNTGSNLLMAGPEIGFNPLRRGIDKLVSPLGNTAGQRSVGTTNWKTLYNSFKLGGRGSKRDFLGGRDFSDLKGKSAKEIYDILANPINTDISNLKYGDKFEVGNRLSFENRPMRVLENMTGTLMKIGDRPFFQAYYDDTLEQLIKMNKGKNIQFKELDEVAHQVASERTYKDMNIISNALLELKNLPKSMQIKMGIDPKTLTGIRAIIAEAIPANWEAQIRFAKTPGNILKRIQEYSPLGIAEGLGKLALNKGNLTLPKQREVVDRLTRGVVGTLGLGLGTVGSAAGLISDKREKNARYEELNTEAGRQVDSLRLNGKNYDLKRGLPFTAPLIAGARLQKGDAKGVINTGIDAASSSLDMFSEMGLLQNIKKFIGNNYGNDDTVGEKILSAVFELPKQYIPSMAKKIKNWVDPYERNLKSNNFIEKNFTNQIGGNLPFVSKLYPAKVDYKGEPIKRFQGENTFVNTILNPIKVTTEVTDDKILIESLRLYGVSKDPQILLPKVTKKIGDRELTIDQQNQYQKIMGNKVQVKINDIINNPIYTNLDDNNKSIAFNHALDLARQEAKEDMLKSLGVNTLESKTKQLMDTANKNVIYGKLGLFKKY